MEMVRVLIPVREERSVACIVKRLGGERKKERERGQSEIRKFE